VTTTTAGPSAGKTEQAAEKAAAGVEQAGQRAAQAVGGARAQAEQRIDDGTTQLGERVSHFVNALRESASSLDSQGDGQAAGAARSLSYRGDKLAGYLEGADAQSLQRDASRAIGERPWMFAAAGLAGGLALARVLRSGAETMAQQSSQQPQNGYGGGNGGA
jgi:vacuolar-type H+-ATPase subunit H